MNDDTIFELEVAYARKFQVDAAEYRGSTEAQDAYGARVQASLHSGVPMQHPAAEEGSVL